MLIFITNRCHMGCVHCMDDCKPEGEDMSFSTFQDAVEFSLTRALPTPLMISGGEPTEHPQFQQFVGYAIQKIQELPTPIPLLILSNGQWLSEHTGFLKSLDDLNLPWIGVQVVIDDRYYPTHVDEGILSQYKCVKLCQGVIQIYPIGRAKDNHLPWQAKASKCFNVRAAVKQLHPASYQDLTLRYSIAHNKFCSPNIGINGELRLGESFLCPACSTIYKSDAEIMYDIAKFKCSGCDFINEKLDVVYKQFL